MGSCLLCGEVVQKNVSLEFIFSFQSYKVQEVCGDCLVAFERIDVENACVGCSGLLERSVGKYCADCEYWRRRYPEIHLKHQGLYQYNEEASEFMSQFKYQGDVLLARVFAEKIREKLKKFSKTHRIVPIPSSARSLAERGFYPVGVLLEEAGIEYEDLLVHIGQDKKQVEKSKEERMQTKQPFKLKELKVGLDRSILLVDDVYTTGRTMLHARDLFEKAVRKEGGDLEKTQVLSCSLFR